MTDKLIVSPSRLTFYNGAPIDYLEWAEWTIWKRKRKGLLRVAWLGGPGWVNLEGIEKPGWLVSEEIYRKVNAEWAQKWGKR